MKKKLFTKSFATAFITLPTLVLAGCSSTSSCTTPTDIASLFCYALCILSGYVVPFLIGLGTILFLVGVLNYVRAGDNEEKRAAGRDMMWFGIVSLFVMISVWGFVKVLSTTFGITYGIPSLPPESTKVFGN